MNPKALAGQPKIAWKASLGTGFSSVAVAGERVYGLGNTGGTDTVFCLNVETGRVLWKHSYRCAQGSYPGPRATPTVHEGVVYTLSREGHLFALEAATGRVRWQKHLADDLGIRSPQWDFAGSVVVAGGLLVLNAGRSGLALDRSTGATVWESGAGPGGYATPVLAELGGRPSAVIFGERAAYGVDVADGTVRWSFPWVTGQRRERRRPGGARRPCLRGLRLRQGLRPVRRLGRRGPRWCGGTTPSRPTSAASSPWTAPCTASTATRGLPNGGILRCLDAATGKTAWSAPVGFGSLIATRDHLVVLNSTGTIVVAEASSTGYRELARSSLPRNQYWTPPALAAGKLFVRNLTGDLFAIDVR